MRMCNRPVPRCVIPATAVTQVVCISTRGSIPGYSADMVWPLTWPYIEQKDKWHKWTAHQHRAS